MRTGNSPLILRRIHSLSSKLLWFANDALPPLALCYPQILLHFQAHFEHLNFIKYTRNAWVRIPAHARTLTRVHEPRGAAPGHRTHSILRARAHPFAVRIGQADPARRGEAPKRLRRLPIPTGCQNKASLPVTTERSGGPLPPHFLGQLRLCPRAGGGCAGHGCPAPALFRPCVPDSEAARLGASCLLFRAERAFSSHFRHPLSFAPLLSCSLSSSHPLRTPSGLLVSWTKTCGRLTPAMPSLQKVAASAAAGGW